MVWLRASEVQLFFSRLGTFVLEWRIWSYFLQYYSSIYAISIMNVLLFTQTIDLIFFYIYLLSLILDIMFKLHQITILYLLINIYIYITSFLHLYMLQNDCNLYDSNLTEPSSRHSRWFLELVELIFTQPDSRQAKKRTRTNQIKRETIPPRKLLLMTFFHRIFTTFFGCPIHVGVSLVKVGCLHPNSNLGWWKIFSEKYAS